MLKYFRYTPSSGRTIAYRVLAVFPLRWPVRMMGHLAIAGVLPQRCRCCRIVTNNRRAGHECNLLSIYIVGDNTNDGVVHTKEFAFQKFAYIHNNPVEAGIVEKAEESNL